MNTIKRKFAIVVIIMVFILIGELDYIVIESSFDNDVKIVYNNDIINEEKEKETTIATTKAAVSTTGNSAISRSKETRLEQPKYSQEDLDLLSHLIYCEAGSDWLSDEHQQLVAMVALNRVKSDKFPNTLKEVIYQQGQYSCIGSDRWFQEPNSRSIENAKLALEGAVYCPDNVIFQAEFKQGSGIYKSFYNEYTSNYTYFCYQ